MPEQHLATYLQDHLAGSVVALDLLKHLGETHAGTDLGTFFARLHEDIVADRRDLEDLIGRVAGSAGSLRAAAGWVGGQAARLKLRLDDAGDGGLRLLEEVELVAVGIEGKRGLWQALAEVAVTAPRLRGPDYDRLVARAVEQRSRIEPVRLNVARAALQ